MLQGQGRLRSRRRREFGRRTTYLRRRSGEIPAVAGAGVVRGNLGVALGVKARLWRWSAGARAQCCGWSTAERIAARRSKVGRSRSRLGVAVMGRRGRRRCSGRLKRAGRDLGYACIRKGIAGDHAGELGREGKGRKETADGAGRFVSDRARKGRSGAGVRGEGRWRVGPSQEKGERASSAGGFAPTSRWRGRSLERAPLSVGCGC